MTTEPHRTRHGPSHEQDLALARAVHDLETWGHSRMWSGTDPYDGQNATRLVAPLRRSALGRRVLTQLVKRSPLDLRPIFGIPAGQDAAGLAHAATGYARGALPGEQGRARLRELVELLSRLRSPAFEEACWGYHFDVQTRVLRYPAGSPNTIATSFAAMALLDAHELLHDDATLELAAGAGEFFLRNVPQTIDGEGAFFGYLPGDSTPIHNANMLVCGLLARLAAKLGRDDMRSAAEAGIAWTVSRQRADGSWPYGEGESLAWVDNFHTGYVLDSLAHAAGAGVEIDGGAALARGLEYYRRELFLPDGTPKYTPASMYPIDGQCLAQAIQTMSMTGAPINPDYGDFAWKVFEFGQREMLRGDGAYMFQRRRFWVNRAAHVRWVVAPMFAALACLKAEAARA